MRKVICANCGGEFDDTEAKCPFCGMIYEPGAEKEYKEKLEDLRSDLDIVDNIAEDSYKADLKLFFKTLLPTLLVATIIGFVGIMIFHVSTTGKISAKRLETEKVIDEVVLAHEYIAQWNALYEEGKYDELLEKVTAEKGKISSSYNMWRYSKFVDTYNYGYDAKRRLEEAVKDEKDSISSYTKISIILDSCEFDYYIERMEQRNKYDGDMEFLYNKSEEIRQNIIEKLDINEADYNEIVSKTTKDGYPSYSDCRDAYEEIYGEDK